MEPSLAKFLIDTNILIDHLRGDASATRFLHEVEVGRVQATISVITESELLSSAHLSIAQLRQIESLLAMLPKLAVTSRVAHIAAQFRRTYRIALPDALIAATAHLPHNR